MRWCSIYVFALLVLQGVNRTMNRSSIERGWEGKRRSLETEGILCYQTEWLITGGAGGLKQLEILKEIKVAATILTKASAQYDPITYKK